MMTIEEKAKRYDEAIQRAHEFCKRWDGIEVGNSTLVIKEVKEIFPELKESEDERIRKEIIEMLKNWASVHYITKEQFGERMTWLEKQGEQKPIDKIQLGKKYKCIASPRYSTFMIGEIYKPEDKFLCSLINFCSDCFEPIEDGEQKPFDYENANIQQKDFTPQEDIPRYNIGDVLCDKSCTTLNKDAQPNFEIIDIRNGMYICDKGSFPISQQDEYELVAKRIEQEPADKVEPKFHEDDWIISDTVDKDYHICKITGIKDGNYTIESTCGYKGYTQFDMFDTAYKLWTIQDAIDGDVLSDGTTIFIFKDLLSDGSVTSYCDYDTDSGESDAFCPLLVNLMCSKITPATKEQHDTLMKSMADAGWGFDFEKKKLKKIDSPVLSNSSNTEKDEPTKWSEEDEKMVDKILTPLAIRYPLDIYQPMYNWLKSLRQRIGE